MAYALATLLAIGLVDVLVAALAGVAWLLAPPTPEEIARIAHEE